MKKQNKIIIYQVFPRWFGNLKADPVKNGSINDNGVGKFSFFTDEVLQRIEALGVTHVWYTGIIEHATCTDYSQWRIRRDHDAIVKGKAGSPYAIKDYYDVDPDLAENVPDRMQEFEAMVERTHNNGLQVIIDFVPNHVARQYYSDSRPPYIEDLGHHDNTSVAFDSNNNFYYIPGQPLTFVQDNQQADFIYSEFPAKATGNDHFDAFPSHNDWYETVKLNYGIDYLNAHTAHFNPIPDTWKKMLDILLFWCSKGVDGFRCDMAEMVPVEFWHWAIPQVKEVHDTMFIAEIYNPSEYSAYLERGCFDYLYDKVGLYDTLRKVVRNELPASNISYCWQSMGDMQRQALTFMENHDEQRIASDFFAGNAQAGFPAMIVAASMNINPVMIYSGQEVGERGMDEEGYSGRDGRTSIFDYWSLSSIRGWINEGKFDGGGLTEAQRLLREDYSKLLNACILEPVIREGGFYDLTYANLNNPNFNPAREYVFLRKLDKTILLVLVNFDSSEHDVQIHIPDEAFRALAIKDNEPAHVKDLLFGDEVIGTLTSSCPYRLTVPAFSGKMLRFTFDIREI